jgi:hypothetical protein
VAFAFYDCQSQWACKPEAIYRLWRYCCHDVSIVMHSFKVRDEINKHTIRYPRIGWKGIVNSMIHEILPGGMMSSIEIYNPRSIFAAQKYFDRVL